MQEGAFLSEKVNSNSLHGSIIQYDVMNWFWYEKNGRYRLFWVAGDTSWICFVERQNPFFHFILPSFIFFLKQKRREKNNGKNKGKNMDADH